VLTHSQDQEYQQMKFPSLDLLLIAACKMGFVEWPRMSSAIGKASAIWKGKRNFFNLRFNRCAERMRKRCSMTCGALASGVPDLGEGLRNPASYVADVDGNSHRGNPLAPRDSEYHHLRQAPTHLVRVEFDEISMGSSIALARAGSPEVIANVQSWRLRLA
jgi:hypothetical protein